uniref:protein FAM214A-like n=1 Tax=Styela clava TaxID=7725 RepID=UPI00193A47A3|nr:protein FAM214A-like [Styela clava]
MARPMSLDLPQTSKHYFDPEFDNSHIKGKANKENPIQIDITTNETQHERDIDYHGIDETPAYKSSRPPFQGAMSLEKKCDMPTITTSDNFSLQIGKTILDEYEQEENNSENTVATSSSSCSVLLRSPPSKLRILPSHCVDKNYLHNPPRQPVHKISTNVAQHGTARRLQFNKPSEKATCTSPAPIRRNNSVRFEFDEDMPKINQRSSRSMCRRKCMKNNGIVVHNHTHLTHTDRLLGSFEESILHNRLEVLGSVEGFHAQLGASGSFCPAKVKLPVPVKFFHVSDDNAPSPYMGTLSVKGREHGKRGYHIPRKGTIQLTLFNPNSSVVKVFVILYDVSDMPPGQKTFLRHRIYSKPTSDLDYNGNVVKNGDANVPKENASKSKCLRYFVNLWLESSKTNKVYIHGDVKILFSLASNEWDSGNTYELQSETEFPKNPKYSPKR